WVQHLGFWVLSFLILTGAFATAWPVATADFIYTLLFHVSLITAVYVHLRLLLPLLLKHRRFLLYGVLVVSLLYGAVMLNEYTFTELSDWLFPGFYFVSDYTRAEIALFIGLYLILTTSFKLSRSWMALQRTRLVLEATRRANVETELMALRAQVNPHFLFNSLHSIYALALEQSTQTPDLILRLSNVLRFMLYETDKKRIQLRDEVACISEYVALQKTRLPDTAMVEWQTRLAGPEMQIAPLLLMPLVDNAFKHGLQGEKTRIRMQLSCTDGTLILDITNTKPGNSRVADDRPGGIGLANVRRRLQLAYPDRHLLSIDEDENQYHVHLKVVLT
ncbi:MAG: histidine kinase, partial [Saprospiraceae bacterium]|nr:histidine kinase [Saprospiraceae bacterium]